MARKNNVKQERPEWGSVYEESKRRLREEVFNEELYDSVCIAFSGGKDSSTVLQMALDAWDDVDEWTKPIHLIHIDDEIVLPETEAFVNEVIRDPRVYIWWCCLPVKYRNACTNEEQGGWWYPWHPEKEDEWFRELPTIADDQHGEVVTLDHPRIAENPEYEFEMGHHQHKHLVQFLMNRSMDCPVTGESMGTTIQCTGLRSAESLTRYNAIVTRGSWRMPPEDAYEKRGGVCVAHPVYDWSDHDLWYAHEEFDWSYNKAYDVQRQIGLAPANMRTAHPYGEEAVKMKNFEELRYAWPDVYDKAKDRVPGARLGFEMGDQLLRVDKRDDQTWAEKCAQLVSQIEDPELQEMQQNRVNRALRNHQRHSTTPMPQYDPCPYCNQSWRGMADSLQKGDLKGRGGL